VNSNSASGILYLDDGETNDYLKKERMEVQFNWKQTDTEASLNVVKLMTDDNSLESAKTKWIHEVQIFNVKTPPISVQSNFISRG
jgi:hypothetical protein